MSNHPVAQEELMAYLDGELSTDRSLIAVAHLERCLECQELAADLRGVSQKLMAWEVEPSSPRMVSEIDAALEKRQREPGKIAAPDKTSWRNRFIVRRWVWAGGLAAACVIVGLGLKLTILNRDTIQLARETGLSAPTARAQRFISVGGLPAADQKSKVSIQADPAAGPVNGKQFDRLEQFSELQTPPKLGDSVNIAGPMIARTAGLTLTTRDFDNARSTLDDILKRHRGYIGQLTVNTTAGAARNFTATLRIPADQLQSTINDLRKLGRVESESQSGEEVTAQYVDLEARLKNVRNTEQRLIDLLRQRTGKLSDVLAVETEIDRVRGEIESMEAERKALANRVDFATVNATVAEDYKEQLQVVPTTTSSRLRNAAVEGYRTMVDGVISLVLFLFSYAPSLLLWAALLFFPVRALWRRFTRNAAS
jgi:hypothetical protein